MFKELNDNTNNAFEFGKLFLAYMLYASKKAGSDLISSNHLNGKSFENGLLHCALVQVTSFVMKTYVNDMKQTDQRIESGAIGYNNNNNNAINNRISGDGTTFEVPDVQSEYSVDIPTYEEAMTGTIYSIKINDPHGQCWIVRRTYKEFKVLHDKINEEYTRAQYPLPLPPNMTTIIATAADYEARADLLRVYVEYMLSHLDSVSTFVRKHICTFLDTKDLVLPTATGKLVHSENITNVFTKMKNDYQEQLTAIIPKAAAAAASKSNDRQKVCGKNKDLLTFQKTWGVEWVAKILDAYSMLQRMSTILSWTLELNHFFLSMFGNTLAFSKLPLKDIIIALKDIFTAFLSTCTSLFSHACQLNAEQQYKWHKNLQAAENYLAMLKHHVEVAVNIINRIETEHLDYEMQMRRLMDVASRFDPFMERVNRALPQIQEELGLPVHKTAITGHDDKLRIDYKDQKLKLLEDAKVQYDDEDKFNESIGSEDGDDFEDIGSIKNTTVGLNTTHNRNKNENETPAIAESKYEVNDSTSNAKPDLEGSKVCVIS